MGHLRIILRKILPVVELKCQSKINSFLMMKKKTRKKLKRGNETRFIHIIIDDIKKANKRHLPCDVMKS